MHYDFIAPGQIHFGWGRRCELGGLARQVGERALLVWGSRTLKGSTQGAAIRDGLQRSGVEVLEVATVDHEPEVRDVDQTVATLRDLKPGTNDFLLAIGGGSSIDLAKAIAAMANAPEGCSVRDYLEGVGRGFKMNHQPLPILAVPTTSGTGSEATKNAVISCYDPPFKKSLRSELLVPRVVLIDPELTVALPPEVTAHTGMDAITQLIESYISRKAQPISQVLAVSGLRLALLHLEEAVCTPNSQAAREAMAQAALLSGMALANSGLGMAHGVAAALGVHHRVRHGLACAVLLPIALRVNRDKSADALARLAVETGLAPTNSSPSAAANALINRVDDLCERLQIPSRLLALGVRANDLPQLAASSRGSSMDGNPRQLSDDELLEILEQHL